MDSVRFWPFVLVLSALVLVRYEIRHSKFGLCRNSTRPMPKKCSAYAEKVLGLCRKSAFTVNIAENGLIDFDLDGLNHLFM